MICVLAFLAAISLIAMVIAYRTPTTVTLRRVHVEFTQVSNVTYLAHAVPSVTYGNRTTVSVGDLLYTNLIKDIELNMSYWIASSRPPRTSCRVYNWSITLTSEAGWSRVLASENGLRFVSPGFRERFHIDMEEVKRIIRRIEAETGLRSIHCAIHVNTSIIASVTLYDGGAVMLKFNPHTSIVMEKGKMIIAPLSINDTKKLETVKTITNYTVIPLGKK